MSTPYYHAEENDGDSAAAESSDDGRGDAEGEEGYMDQDDHDATECHAEGEEGYMDQDDERRDGSGSPPQAAPPDDPAPNPSAAKRKRERLSWEARFRQLEEFKEEHGHTNVNRKTHKPLGTWVTWQRLEYRKFRAGKETKMNDERVMKLTGIGFIWDVTYRNFGRYQKIGRYYAVRTGRAAPDVGVRSAIFFHWADARRFLEDAASPLATGGAALNKSELMAEYAAFDSIQEAESYLWEVDDIGASNVEEEYREAERQQEENVGQNKHSDQDEEGSDEEEETVVELPLELAERLRRLEKFKLEHGRSREERRRQLQAKLQAEADAEDEYSGEENILAGTRCGRSKDRDNAEWDSDTDEEEDQNEHSSGRDETGQILVEETVVVKVPLAERLRQLQRFKHEHSHTWEERYRQLVNFKEWYGHTGIPRQSGSFGKWVHLQRMEYKKFKAGEKTEMTSERALKLANIDFSENVSNIRKKGKVTKRANPMIKKIKKTKPPRQGGRIRHTWDERFRQLEQFKEEHGKTTPSQRYGSHIPLGNWVHQQRGEYNKLKAGKMSKLDDDKIRKLTELDFYFFEPAWKRARVEKEAAAGRSDASHPTLPPFAVSD